MLSSFRIPTNVRTAVCVLALCAALPARTAAQGETVEYYATDALGSVRAVFDASGNVLGRMDYAPFGEELYTGLFLPSERFAQLTRDGEAGQDYAKARMYQVRTGRFNAPDAIYAGLFRPQNWNRYAYGLNNPIVYSDPSGLCPDCPVFRSGVVQDLPDLPDGLRGAPAGPGGGGGGDDTIIAIFEDEPGFGVSLFQNPTTPPSGPTTPDDPGPENPPGEENPFRCAARISSGYSIASLFGASEDNWLAQTFFGNDFAALTDIAFDIAASGPNAKEVVGAVIGNNAVPFNITARTVDAVVNGIGPRDVAKGHETPWGHFEVDRFERRIQFGKVARGAAVVAKGLSTVKLAYDGAWYAGSLIYCVAK